MQKRITYNDLLRLYSQRFEEHEISMVEYKNIKDHIHLRIQNEIVLDSNEPFDFSKPFYCVEFSEGYVIIYHYNP